jgi:hypothetical protein
LSSRVDLLLLYCQLSVKRLEEAVEAVETLAATTSAPPAQQKPKYVAAIAPPTAAALRAAASVSVAAQSTVETPQTAAAIEAAIAASVPEADAQCLHLPGFLNASDGGTSTGLHMCVALQQCSSKAPRRSIRRISLLPRALHILYVRIHMNETLSELYENYDELCGISISLFILISCE